MDRAPVPPGAPGHRVLDTRVTLRHPDGRTLDDTEVVLEQVRHAVAFANIGFDFVGLANGETAPQENVFGGADPEAAARLVDLWLAVFDTATLPFYWQGFEPAAGEPQTARLLATAQWFHDRGIALKGHPLVWHTLTPTWLATVSDEDVEAALRSRIRRELTAFRGLVPTWDVVNEAVIMPVFSNEDTQNAITRLCHRKGRLEIIRLAFEEARRADPGATLVLNDFDTSTAYECLIEGVLEAGIEVDAIGVQSHMHQGYWGEEKTWDVIERFARYGLPLHFTETTLVSGETMPPEIEDLNDFQPAEWPSTPAGEERQADEIVRHYRTLMSHPAVEAVTYWGITDAGAWLGAPGGLVRADGTPKPAHEALRRLLKEEWWLAPTSARTGAHGEVGLRGWAGTYAVSALGSTMQFELSADQPTLDVVLDL